MPGARPFPNGLKEEVVPLGAHLVRAHRFDSVDGQYRMLYAAEKIDGAFVETVLRNPVGRILRRSFVDARGWSVIRIQRKLVLAKLRDEGLQWHGVDASISTSDDYAASRSIAAALHREFPMSTASPTDRAMITASSASRSSTASCPTISR